MKKLKKNLNYLLIGIVVAILIFMVAIIFLRSSLFRELRLQWSVEQLMEKTDKIVITYNSRMSSYKPVSYTLKNDGCDSFLKCMRFQIPKSGSIRTCSCLGNPTVQFFSKNKLVDSFTLHHGKAVRWNKFRWGDIPIISECQVRLRALFAKYGIYNTEELRSE